LNPTLRFKDLFGRGSGVVGGFWRGGLSLYFKIYLIFKKNLKKQYDI
jgi:hypothetical protein